MAPTPKSPSNHGAHAAVRELIVTSLAELKTLRDKARAMGHTVTLFYTDDEVMDQVYILLKGGQNRPTLYDPLGAAEFLRGVTA